MQNHSLSKEEKQAIIHEKHITVLKPVSWKNTWNLYGDANLEIFEKCLETIYFP
jgi:hypothetical protein